MDWLFLVKLLVFIVSNYLILQNLNKIFRLLISKNDHVKLKEKLFFVVYFISILFCLLGGAFLVMAFSRGILDIEGDPLTLYNRHRFGDLFSLSSVAVFIYVIIIQIRIYLHNMQIKTYNKAMTDLYREKDNLKSELDWENIMDKYHKNENQPF